MQKKQQLFACLFFIFLISGCWERKPTYMYLMAHPDYLQQSYNKCVQEIVSPTIPCKVIMHAQADFTRLINQREQDSERFGAQILQAQADNAFFKSKFEKALYSYNSLGKNNHDMEELKKMRLELDKAREEYRDSADKVLILLSVIAATSMV